jgi:hypothetical protein
MEYYLEKRRLEKTTGWQAQSVRWIPPESVRWIPPDVTLKYSACCPHSVLRTHIYVFCVDLRADSSGRAVYDVDLLPLACWDCGFEPRRRHGSLFVVSVVCAVW